MNKRAIAIVVTIAAMLAVVAAGIAMCASSTSDLSFSADKIEVPLPDVQGREPAAGNGSEGSDGEREEIALADPSESGGRPEGSGATDGSGEVPSSEGGEQGSDDPSGSDEPARPSIDDSGNAELPFVPAES